jgi:MFS family permease
VWLLVTARAVNRLGAFTLPFLAVTLMAELGASVTGAGLLMAAFGAATIPSRLLGGRLTDRWGARRTIAVGLVGTACAQLLVATSTTLEQAAVAVVLLGLAFEVYEPPSQALIADVTPAEQRPVAFGLLAAGLAGAGMAAGVLASLLAGLDLRWLFVADAATCLACAALVALRLPSPSDRSLPAVREDARPWRDRRLRLLLALGSAFAVVYLQLTVTLPLTVTARGLQPFVVGLLLTVSAATVVLAQPLLTLSWVRGLDDASAMAIGYVAMAGGFLMTAVANSLTALMAATAVWSIGDLVLMARAYSLVAGIAPEHGRGAYLAAYGTSWGVAAVVAPVAGTQLLDRIGPTATWACLAATCLALAGTWQRRSFPVS